MREFKSELIPKPRSSILAPEGKFDLEIGCGAGLHPIQYAIAHPDRHLIAIERTLEKFLKFEKRWKSHECPKNLVPIHDDAISWITHNVANEQLQRVFILYPNPEPKNKNQRWAHMPFLSHLVDKLAKDAELTLASNIKSYIDECVELFADYGLKLKSLSTPTLPGRTHFERKYLKDGQDCYNLVFVKV
ncbi:MAG: SAM-dependent methyltransferase [Bdellovibrionales bacterium CG12_big_fil_rev_8_21_14_0_65_38_15]|nr:MAG: SAM-dependent methyltransferase [Bdellovibrionales bacterium CG22_combo_CG10-13_8_21_14_all_38_13]PIQ54197.1 MAG: SAM-dependent methyltransferase [Bdellovibrionales bacterium CG12_big_fil_rev_8_21_14_0_65_38_15]PIR29255.1 MAG: SAM-dependent methyltransferase [Bdellovibrionales bacterium CG11_big_fil_rev_8_21_14_0_20_38_13]